MKLISRTAPCAAALVFLSGLPVAAGPLSQVRMHFASGPASVFNGQTATTCAVNPDSETVPVLVALLRADNGNVVATRITVLQAGAGLCVSWTRPALQQGDNNFAPQQVYAVVVPNGRIESSGRIVQDRPGGGGCIVGSLQIQLPGFNNTPGQTIIFAQMVRHDHSGDQD